MVFMLQDVIKEIEESCSLDPIKNLQKKNLVEAAVHFGITPAVSATKSHILDLIENYCIDNDIINEVEEKPIAELAEVLKLKLEFQHEESRLACEEAQRVRKAEKALQDAQLATQREEVQRAREAVEAEAQKELRLAELKEACELRELELKAEQEKALLAAEIEAKKEAAAREHELKMAGLGKQSPSDRPSAFDPARNIIVYYYCKVSW